MKTFTLLAGLAMAVTMVRGQENCLFKDDFADGLGSGWSWLREEKSAWRISNEALEMRVLAGNLWGPANDAKNILSRPAPDAATMPVEVFVTVSNSPTHQYEQANLAWYFSDSNMVKLGLELVDGKICIVMGREENDYASTLAKIPVTFTSVRLRLIVDGSHIRGQYRATGTDKWLDAGMGEIPSPKGGRAKISLHCYQGDPATEHWARFSEFRVARPYASR